MERVSNRKKEWGETTVVTVRWDQIKRRFVNGIDPMYYKV